jgi:hypothetical protein
MGPLLPSQRSGLSPDCKAKEAAVEGRRGSALRSEEKIMKVNLTIGIPAWLDRICAWPVMVYRKRKNGYTYRRIYLGEGVWTVLDEQDYYRLGHFKWTVIGDSGKFYAVRSVKVGQVKTKTLRLHREIMNPPKRRLVDHKNGDSLDNRRDNLRLATRAQNVHNRRKTKSKTSSRFIGVFYEKRYHYWVAKIEHKGKVIWLGSFKSEVEAAKAYDRAALKLRGEFARLNFPRENYVNEVLV